MPLAEAVEIPLPIHRGGLLRALSFLLAHQMRTVTYVPVLVVALALRPKQTAIALGVYWGVLCPRLAWQNAVHKWLAWASSNKPRFLNCMRQKAYDPSKQYLVGPATLTAYSSRISPTSRAAPPSSRLGAS